MEELQLFKIKIPQIHHQVLKYFRRFGIKFENNVNGVKLSWNSDNVKLESIISKDKDIHEFALFRYGSNKYVNLILTAEDSKLKVIKVDGRFKKSKDNKLEVKEIKDDEIVS